MLAQNDISFCIYKFPSVEPDQHVTVSSITLLTKQKHPCLFDTNHTN
jgi:hypothetical protein